MCTKKLDGSNGVCKTANNSGGFQNHWQQHGFLKPLAVAWVFKTGGSSESFQNADSSKSFQKNRWKITVIQGVTQNCR